MAEQIVRQTPAEFIEAPAKAYIQELETAVGGLKDLDLSRLYGPQFLAQPGALQTQAEQLASGLGGFQPFLTAAQASTGPQAFQQFMSPYQQDVIDTTLAEFDRQTAAGIPGIAAQAIGAGAFGGGREGVLRSEFASNQARNRAALQAQLLQQGFGQAQQLAAQNFQQQLGLAQAQPSLLGQQISALGALGSQQQQREQSELAARQQLAQRQAFQPLEAAQTLGQGIMGLISGYPASTTTTQLPAQAGPSGLATGLGVASTLAGIYGALNPRPLFQR